MGTGPVFFTLAHMQDLLTEEFEGNVKQLFTSTLNYATNLIRNGVPIIHPSFILVHHPQPNGFYVWEGDTNLDLETKLEQTDQKIKQLSETGHRVFYAVVFYTLHDRGPKLVIEVYGAFTFGFYRYEQAYTYQDFGLIAFADLAEITHHDGHHVLLTPARSRAALSEYNPVKIT